MTPDFSNDRNQIYQTRLGVYRGDWRKSMKLENLIISSLVNGVLAAALWIGFWNFVVPQVLPGLAWLGHEGLIVPVFVIVSSVSVAKKLW